MTNPYFCIGDLLAEREATNISMVVKSQLVEGLFGPSGWEFQKIVIAYETCLGYWYW